MFHRKNTDPQDRIAIDLGAFHTRFYSATSGLLLDEPSIGALNMDHRIGGDAALVAFGNNAVERIEGKRDQLRGIHPLQSDAHNNLGLSRKMLEYFFNKAKQDGLFKKQAEVSLVLAHDYDAKTAQQLLQVCLAAGASKADYQDAAMSAFLGSPFKPTDTGIIIDFGATGSRLIAVTNNEVKHYQNLAFGGDDIDLALCAGLLEHFQFVITPEHAREVKHNIGAATAQSLVQPTRKSINISGLSLKTNVNSQYRISSETVNYILQPLLDSLLRSITLAYASVDRDIKDAAFSGAIQICGGGALLSRMDQLVMAATDLPVEVVNRPLTCVVRGAAKQLVDAKAPLKLTEPV